MDKKDKNKTNNAEAEVKKDAENAKNTAEAELPDEIVMTRDEFEQVKKHIETLQKEKDDMVDTAKRVQAEFDNYRKRNANIHQESHQDGEREVIKSLLPVLDNFERAMDNSEKIDDAWCDGIRLVYKQLVETLQKKGLEEIPAEGQFDPNFHEAVLQEEAEGVNSGDILMTLQKGYKVNERIIRHSMVKVAK